jgi:hypothetical protein
MHRPQIAALLCAFASVLGGCATTVTGTRSECSSLVPQNWADGIAPVPLPAFDKVGEVLTAFIDQSARLESANARTKDTLTIVRNCEALVNASRRRGGFR